MMQQAKREAYGKPKDVDAGKPKDAEAEKAQAAVGGKPKDEHKLWTENVGTDSNPRMRQVRVGTFVYSESQGKWLPREDDPAQS